MQTAVEYLLNEFQKVHKDFGGIDLEWLKRFDQAKEMESEKNQKFDEMLEMLKSVLKLQKENYGNGMNTHLAMITKAKEIEQLIKEVSQI